MAEKVIKQMLLKFYDNERDKEAVAVLDDQINTSEFLRQLIVDADDAIRLFESLIDGRIDVLFEMFPEIKSKLDASSLPPTDSGELESIRRRLERLESERMLSSIPPSSYQMAAKAMVTAPTQSFGTKAPPVVDRKALEEGKSDGKSANNLLDSLNNF